MQQYGCASIGGLVRSKFLELLIGSPLGFCQLSKVIFPGLVQEGDWEPLFMNYCKSRLRRVQEQFG